MKSILLGLKGVTRLNAATARKELWTARPSRRWTSTEMKLRLFIMHPLVRSHPLTGRRSLFVNEVYTVGIEGLTNAESSSLLKFLFGANKLTSHVEFVGSQAH